MLIEAGLFALLDSPTSPVAHYVTFKAIDVAVIARQNVQTNFRSRTGNLEASIGIFPRETPDGLEVEVGTQGAPYGLVLEQGAEPHEIIAVRANVLESLPDNPDPLVGYREREDPTRVIHPGSGAKPWLKPALELVFGA
jgi:hypothetical protein